MKFSNKWLALLVVLLVISFGFSTQAVAQVTYAAIHGTVTDQSGAVVPNAHVTVTNTSTGITTTATTDNKGYYVFPQLSIGGPYVVSVTAPGFNEVKQSDLMLNLNDNRDVDARLSVGTSAQTVSVNAAAIQVETSDTQLKQDIGATTLEQAPLLGRDAAILQKLAPGTVESSDRFGTFSSNGSQTPQNSFLLNGADINDFALQSEGIQINPDALQEENIVTSTINPEFSRNSGAVLNQVLKSGTNQFHGSGFEFYRDTFLTNGNYFSPTRPIFHQNVFGGTLGGPILKNKLFFFAAYQGTRNRTAATNSSEVFNNDQRAGIFNSSSLNYVTGNDGNGLSSNPIPFAIGACPAGEAWNKCFPAAGGDSTVVNIPSSQWNPIAASLFNKYVPAANQTIGGTPYYFFNALNTNGIDQGILRADFTPSSKDSVWASSVFQGNPSTAALSFGGGTLPGFAEQDDQHYKLFQAAWTHTFNPTLLNELRAGYTRLNYHAVNPLQQTQPSSLGFSINPELQPAGIPYISVGPYFALGNSYEGPQPRKDTNLTVADALTKVLGNHSLKFGASVESFRVSNPFAYLNNGYYYYNGGGQYSSGDPAIDYLLGIPDGYEQTNDGFIDALSYEYYAYGQDSWKVNSDFTLNAGVSWDVETPVSDVQYDGYGIFCYLGPNFATSIFPGAPPGMAFKGDPGCNEAGSPTTHWNRLSPRLGFAWSPSSGPEKLIGASGNHELSIRGGFGIYYNRDQEEQSLQNLTDPPALHESFGAADFGGSPSFATPYTDVAGNGSEANQFPYAAPTKPGSVINWPLYSLLNAQAFDRNYMPPYVMNYNLNIQRALPFSMIGQIGYVGSVGHRLASWYEADPITQAGHNACAAGATTTIYGNTYACNNTAITNKIHNYFPQFTANPAVVAGSASAGFANGVPWYTSVASQNSEGSSNYNSFQASLIKSPTHGLQFTLAYTYSHALDNFSGYESSTGAQGRVRNFVPQYQYLNYGSSDYDARQRLVASYNYVVPVVGFMRNNLFLRESLSGWQVSGITAFQTGFPVSIYGSGLGAPASLYCDESFFGCADVPNVSTSHVSFKNIRKTGYWFDTTPYSAEQIGTFGNTQRNYFHGPGFDYTNLQISKNFPLDKQGARYVQLRLEGYNVFNHANFANPNGNFNSPGFGQVTSVIQPVAQGDPQPGRAVQLAGKVYF